MTLTYRCRVETVPTVRRRVASELRHHLVDDDVVDRLVLATAEACNNAITHSDCTNYLVTMAIEGGLCTIVVIDSGGGFEVPERFEMPDPHAVSRRGLALMCALVDDVEVTSNPEGTMVVLRHPLALRVAQAALA